MTFKKGNEPKFTDKEGNVQLSAFKNKNVKGVEYIMFVLSIFKFPFKFNQKIMINTSELEKLKILLDRVPKIEIKEKKKK